jgi:hypothetical protein
MKLYCMYLKKYIHSYGVLLSGTRQIWFKDVNLEIVEIVLPKLFE